MASAMSKLPDLQDPEAGKTWFTMPPRGEARVVLCWRSDDDQILTTSIRLDRWLGTSLLTSRNNHDLDREISRQFMSAFGQFAREIYDRFGLGRTEGKQGEDGGQPAPNDQRLPRPESSGDRPDERDQGGGGPPRIPDREG
jgi:hypothetical protein